MSSQNIRSLLRAELSTRRITHPHASYTNSKSSLLSCTVCHLIIKSESLWEGHLRSANHRKNVQKLQQGGQRENDSGDVVKAGGRKRKADSLDLDEREDGSKPVPISTVRKRKAEDVGDDDDEAADGRKKTKGQPQPPPPQSQLPPSRVLSGFVPASVPDAQPAEPKIPSRPDVPPPEQQEASSPTTYDPAPTTTPAGNQVAPTTAPEVNESEYLAFESEILPLLTPQNPPPSNNNIYTISAPPLSSADLQRAAEAEAKQNQTKSGRSLREEEAEAELEEEGRRMDEEFEVQEQMEGRVRRLREVWGRLKAEGKAGGGGTSNAAGAATHEGGDDVGVLPDGVAHGDGGAGMAAVRVEGGGEVQSDGDSSSSSDEDEFDEWGFS